MNVAQNTSVMKRIRFLLEYFCGLFFICGILFLAAGGLNSLGIKIFRDVSLIYRQQIIDTIAIVIPSIVGYFLLRIFDIIVIKKNQWRVLKTQAIDSFSGSGKKILIGILLFFSAFLLVLIIMCSYYALVFLLGWTEIVEASAGELTLLRELVFCLCTSLREEFLFRFFLIPVLAYGLSIVTNNKVSVLISLAITSTMFALSHFFVIQERPFSWFLFILDITAGLVLGIAFIQTKTLYFPIGFHLGWNFFLGAIPEITKITDNHIPGWSSLLAVVIILIVMIPVFGFSRTVFKNHSYLFW